MFKKALLIATFILFTATLVYGASNRTLAKTTAETHVAGQSAEGRGQGALAKSDAERQFRNTHEPLAQGGGNRQGEGNQNNVQSPSRGQGNGQARDRSEALVPGAGQGNGSGAAAPNQGNQGRGQNQQSSAQAGQGQNSSRSGQAVETVLITGTISQAPAAGVELILQTSAGEVQIGTGPDYLGEIGFVLEAGDEVSINGFWEDGEFKASTITLLSDGRSAALRDETGRPMWSGAARGGRGGGQAAGDHTEPNS